MGKGVQETNSARMVLYALIRSFLDGPPNGEKLGYWLLILDALQKGTGSSAFDEAVSRLGSVLKEKELVDIQNEFYELFENPFGNSRLQPFASYYIDGKIMGTSLVKLRQLLYNLNLGKEECFRETEDHLVFLLDLMIHLIQKGSQGQESGTSVQGKIIHDYILPTVKGMQRDLSAHGNFAVYRAVLEAALAFFTLDECLFPSMEDGV